MASSVPPPDVAATMARARACLTALERTADDLRALREGADAVKRRRRLLDDLAAEFGRQQQTT
ncbi:hypothetical protein [Mycobacterium aquaticum]|uniref:Uncharacterized protein n=1 Tax=Mycobacterium aquaticum TaxID=1927124 RepID=A0A1X0ANX5_9MYCO|nr:hypothetical protein [Mycobacterium aquaticum]ORA31740.1 hypothetical protein BST13_24430 [Mycobacterium aquaticum]